MVVPAEVGGIDSPGNNQVREVDSPVQEDTVENKDCNQHKLVGVVVEEGDYSHN